MLEEYFGKIVSILADNNKIYIGKIGFYIPPFDNEDGVESIILETKDHKNPIEFKEKEILKITELT